MQDSKGARSYGLARKEMVGGDRKPNTHPQPQFIHLSFPTTHLLSQYTICKSMLTRKTNMWHSIRTSLSVEGGKVWATATIPMARPSAECVWEKEGRRGRRRPVTWITYRG